MNSNIEIERRWLVGNIPEDLETYQKQLIEQRYTRIPVIGKVRIRRTNGHFEIRKKFKTKGGELGANTEIHYHLPNWLVLIFWTASNISIVKSRYFIPLNPDLNIHLDLFGSQLTGHAIAEIEFPPKYQPLVIPGWFGEEITTDTRYSNRHLAETGWPQEV